MVRIFSHEWEERLDICWMASDVYKRFAEHEDGLVQSTKAYRPLRLAAYIAVPSSKKARELERYFKAGSGKAVLKKRILTDEAPLGA